MLSSIFGPKKPSFAKGRFVPITKGYNLDLRGDVSSSDLSTVSINRFSIQPTDFLGISPIPKVVVAEGDVVKLVMFCFMTRRDQKSCIVRRSVVK